MELHLAQRRSPNNMKFGLEEAIHWALLKRGPMDQAELINALSDDYILGYVPLNTMFLQAKVKGCLEQMMQHPNPLLYFGEERKIKISKARTNSENLKPIEIPFDEPWLKMGTGIESVYAIFSATTMNKYVEAGLDKYPIKIGRTNRPIENRIHELQTGSYLNLRIGIQFSTDSSKFLENEIHKKLDHMRVISRSTSNEWFYTNLREIREIYCNLLDVSDSRPIKSFV